MDIPNSNERYGFEQVAASPLLFLALAALSRVQHPKPRRELSNDHLCCLNSWLAVAKIA
jgi:hypothetical protein